MKKLLILLFSILISFNSYGGWVYYDDDIEGDSFYLDQDSIKQHNEYVYFWYLKNYLKPGQFGDMSVKVYLQGECRLNRYKPLSYIFYKQPMGKGKSETYNPPPEWDYPAPGSLLEVTTNYVCNYLTAPDDAVFDSEITFTFWTD